MTRSTLTLHSPHAFTVARFISIALLAILS